jgi:hypothetical protein
VNSQFWQNVSEDSERLIAVAKMQQQPHLETGSADDWLNTNRGYCLFLVATALLFD